MYRSIEGILTPAENGVKRLFTAVEGKKPFNDAEAKVIESIARSLGATEAGQVFKDVKGTLTITSQLQVCSSCSNIIEQFRKMFPSVNINI